MFVRTQSKLVVVTPVLDTNIYASGDRLGAIQKLTNALSDDGYLSTLASVSVIDVDNQKSAMDLLFFNDLPTVASADNAAIDISDAEMVSKYLGSVSIGASDWSTILSGGNAVASMKSIGFLLRGVNKLQPHIYVVVVSRGTPTYSAAGLTFKYGIYGD